MIVRPALSLLILAIVLCFPNQASAVLPTEVAAGLAAAKATPQVFQALRGLAEVPAAVGQTLNLPLGLLETALCPLPGATLAGGLKRTMNGLMGPFKLVGTVLKLPLSVVDAAAGAVTAIP